MMSKHKHYDLIIEWCRNPQKYKVYYKQMPTNTWRETDQPVWDVNTEYKLEPKVQDDSTKFHELNHGTFFTFVDESAKIAYGKCRKIIVPSEYFSNRRANADDRSMFMDESGCIRKCQPDTRVELQRE
jgi:hypothetical protein